MDKGYPEHLDDIDYLRGNCISGPHPTLLERDAKRLDDLAGRSDLTTEDNRFLQRVLEKALQLEPDAAW